MIRLVLLAVAVTMLVVAGYLVISDGVHIDVDKTKVIVDDVQNTGEGLEQHVPDFTQQKGYS